MKTISTDLSAHLDGEVTTLCTCWRVERTDGAVLGFTTLDQDIDYNGVIYESQYGYARTALSAGSDMSVDNMDVTGVLDSDTISNDDLRNGAYNFARVYVFLLNYEDVSQGELALRTGWFGEVSMSQRGEFTAELRGLNQALSHTTIEVFTPECRADFCDKRCKLNALDFTRRATVYDQIVSRNQFRATSLPDVPSESSAGAHRVWGIKLMTVPDANHAGFTEIKFYDQNLQEITGGTAYANSSQGKHGPEKARDGRNDTSWRTDGGSDTYDNIHNAHWWVVFPNDVDVKEVSITCGSVMTENPTRFALQYGEIQGGDVNTIDFTEVQQFTGTWPTAYANHYWGIGGGTTPLDTTAGYSSIPVPFTGMSTYVGGTVTFRSGANRGKAMEIIGYNNQTITLFDNLPFPIAPGDTFDIMQGCNKDRETCRLYNNILNFRGEPDVPGQDEYLKYPDAPTG